MCSPIAEKISRNRFREINRYFHFVNNSTRSPPGSPTMGWPVLDYLHDQFSSVYTPGQALFFFLGTTFDLDVHESGSKVEKGAL